MRQSLGLCVIAKDESKNIKRLLENICGYVDMVYLTDTGSTDDTIKVAQNICKDQKQPLEISHFKWCNSFSKARNFNFEQAKTDWILWVDADDTVEHPEKVREFIDYVSRTEYTAIAMPYRYEVDENNADLTVHDKDRILRNGLYEWTNKVIVHENAFAKSGVKDRTLYPAEQLCKVRHWATHEDLLASGKRNIRMLEDQEKTEGANPDPRTVFYLGREYHAQNKFSKAGRKLEQYIQMVVSGHERANACEMLGHMAAMKGDFYKELNYGFEAIKSDPDAPLSYISLASAYANLGEYEQAIEWVEKSLTKKISTNKGEVQSPKGIQKQAIAILFDCYCNLEQYEKAAVILKEYAQVADKNEDLQEHMTDVRVKDVIQKQVNAFTILANSAIGTDRLEAIKGLIKAMPESLQNEKAVLRLKRTVGLGKEWNKGNIVIYCGSGIEQWDQDSSAIGGSETAVIEVARRLVGYNVTVYGSVTEKKTFGHVTYLPAVDIEWADKFDIFIAWRNPVVFKMLDVFAKKKYLWLHDVPNPAQFTKKVYSNIDQIIVLSKYHRSFLPAVPEEKFYYSRNGIDLKLIQSVQADQSPHKIIYSSSADRGLETLLDMMPELQAKDSQVELVWAYGWEVFDKIRTSPEDKRWKALIEKKMALYGVKQLGRLNKRELYQEMKSARIWAYPTRFSEISCISCMEAMACGCIPVSSGHAALAETQTTGFTEKDNQKFVHRIVEILRSKMNGVEVEGNDWQLVVDEWKRDLFYGDFEDINPLVSVCCVTIRPGIFRVLREQIEKQSYRNIELVVIDGRYEERKEAVAEYMKDFGFVFKHLPDPKRDRKKYPYGLHHADNAALAASEGDLMVFLQDLIEIPVDGIEKYVNIYKNHPEALISGVDFRYGYKAETIDKNNPIDVFDFKPYSLAEKQYTNGRMRIGGAVRRTPNPFEWELNWCAAPRAALLELGGWDDDWDSAFSFDNTVIAIRYLYLGGQIIIDETNKANAISHWDMFPHDDMGVPHRDVKTNDNRYLTYSAYLDTVDNANVKLTFNKDKYLP